MKNSKNTIIGVVIAVVAILLVVLIGSYNGLVGKRENVRNKISTMQSQYQRRADLVPNLVATVKGAADFEQSTLTAVTDARANATKISLDPSKATPEQIQQYQEAQGQLSQALGRLLAVSENYPDLKATQAFRDLTVQLEGTENRIQVARQDYGTAVQDYNGKIKRFPTAIIAAMFGFDEFPYFQADAGSEKAPQVDFNPTSTSAPTVNQPAPVQ